MNARDYYLDLQDAIHAAPHVVRSDVQFEEIDTNECYVRGVFTLIGGFELHIAEYVVTEPVVTRPKYRYHLQTSDGKLVSRGIARRITLMLLPYPDHRHDDQDEVHPTPSMNVPDVLEAVLKFI